MATSMYAPTVERWLADLANTGRSKRTLEAYRRDVDDTMLTVAGLKGITGDPLEVFEQLDVAAVGNDDLIAAIADYRTRPDPRYTTNPQRAPDERAPATVARRTAAVRTFFAWCYEHDVIPADPAAKLRTPPKRKRLPKALPPTVAAAALDTAQEGAGSRWPERDALIVALALACGLRLEEIATLTVDAIAGDGDGRQHQWLVVRGKGDKERRLGVPPVVADAIAAYLPTREQRLEQLGLDARTLVISSRPRPVRDHRTGETLTTTVEASRESVAYVVDRLLRRLGARRAHVRVHALRHTFATLGLQAGTFNLRQLQTALGHASLATTQLYTEVADDDLADAMARHPLAVSRPSQPG
jgi:site-specific recombinase XerD